MVKRIGFRTVTGGINVFAELTNFLVKKISKHVRQLVLWKIGRGRGSRSAHKVTGNFEMLFGTC